MPNPGISDLGVHLLARLEFDPNSGCWLYSGYLNSRGYGSLGFEGKKLRVHRITFEQWVGPIPADLWVLHHCDTPPCCNPAHLFLGDTQANVADREAKDRGYWKKGSRHPNAKLSEGEVGHIQRMLAENIPIREIANEMKVVVGTIYHIKNGANWKHLP